MELFKNKYLVVFIEMVVLTWLFNVGSVLADTPPIPEKWTPEATVQFALANNPDMAITRQRIASAEASVLEASSAFYPRLDSDVSYMRTNNPMYSFGNILNQGEFNQNIDFNNPGTTDTLTMKAMLSYRLYNGGRSIAGLDAAKAKKEATSLSLNATRAHLAFAVVQNFFTIVQAEEMLQARTSAVEAIEASVEVARARNEAGDLLKTDLLNLEVHLSEAQENSIQAKHAVNLSKRSLLNLLGLEQQNINISRSCDIDQLIPTDLSYENRVELKMARASIAAAGEGVKLAKGGYRPTADAFASYQVDQGYELDGSGNSWMTGVKVNFNLFAGRQTEAQVAAAKAMLAEQQELLRKLTLQINLEVEKARLALAQAEKRYLVTKQMVELAQESASLNRERFKEGLILSSELIDVENRLTDSQVRMTLARAAKRIAVADLRRAVGLDQF